MNHALSFFNLTLNHHITAFQFLLSLLVFMSIRGYVLLLSKPRSQDHTTRGFKSSLSQDHIPVRNQLHVNPPPKTRRNKTHNSQMKTLTLPMMKLLRRPLSLLFSASFSTVPPVPSPSLTFLQSVLNQIKHLSANPKHYPSLTTLDSLLTNTHMLNPATSLIIIDYLTRINKLSRAKTLISHLNSSGTVSQPFLYSLLFNFLLKDSLINHIESLWADICGSVKRLNFSFSDYVILVCKFGEPSEVKDVYNMIFMDCGSFCLERQSYVALSASLCSLNEGFLAKNVVNEMYVKGMVVDNWTYFSMFKCFCRNGDFDEADLALRKLVKNGFVVDICVYGSWIHGLCKSGKYREADKLFKKLIKRGSAKKFREEKKVLKEGRRAIFQLNCGGVVPELMAYV
ncbi:putative tetratricopeptide-like helical domain superfamily [Helianthus annuus]|nr:putative tetratricopeptide-like helical domain superfamily [Helianthus annuus]